MSTHRNRTTVPGDLIAAVRRLTFEDESDQRHAMDAVAVGFGNSNEVSIKWLAALVARNGAKFDRSNDDHCQPHNWP